VRCGLRLGPPPGEARGFKFGRLHGSHYNNGVINRQDGETELTSLHGRFAKNIEAKMGGKQIVVFLIHRQVIEALSLRPREIDRGNLLQRLRLQANRKGENRNEIPEERLFDKQSHGAPPAQNSKAGKEAGVGRKWIGGLDAAEHLLNQRLQMGRFGAADFAEKTDDARSDSNVQDNDEGERDFLIRPVQG